MQRELKIVSRLLAFISMSSASISVWLEIKKIDLFEHYFKHLVVWTQNAGEGTVLYALFCAVAVRLHCWAVNNYCLNVSYVKYYKSKFSCWRSYLVDWLLFFQVTSRCRPVVTVSLFISIEVF